MVEARDLVDQFYELLAIRDTEGLNAILAADMIVTYHATPGELPWAGEFHGREGFALFLQIVGEHLEIAEAQRAEPFGDGRQFVVATKGRWRVKANGAVAEGSMLNIFTISEDRISGYEVYADTAAFLRALSQ